MAERTLNFWSIAQNYTIESGLKPPSCAKLRVMLISKILSLFILLLLTMFSAASRADAMSLNLIPTQATLGDPVQITVPDIPAGNFTYLLTVSLSSVSSSGTSMQVQVTDDNCVITAPSAAFTSRSQPTCFGNGPFQLNAVLDTAQIGADRNSTSDLEYSVIFGGVTKNFTIKAPKQVTFGFAIDSISPNPAALGSTININITAPKAGTYRYAISGDSERTATCSIGACSFSLTVPSTISCSPATVIVINPDNNRTQSSLAVTGVPTTGCSSTAALVAAKFDFDDTTKTCRPSSPQTCTPNTTTKKCLSLAECNDIVLKQYGCDKNITDPLNPLYCTAASGEPCRAGDYSSVKTAIGCIPTDPPTLINSLLKFSAGVAGGIALLLMAFGAIGLITSAGNEEAKKAAMGRFTSAIVGLVFILFSIVLLRIIGVEILNIPGFR
jgi:hypothetical protein